MFELLIKSKVKSKKSKGRREPIRVDANFSLRYLLHVILFILFFVVPAFSFYEILESNTVKEGGIIKIKIGAPQGAKAADIIFLDQKYPAFFRGFKVSDRELVYTAMVPVPLGTKGRKKLTIRVMLPDGIQEKEEKINVKQIKEIKSEVDTGGQMGRELLDSLAKENKIIHMYVEGINPVKYDLPFIKPFNGEITTAFGAARIYDNGEAAWRHKGLDLAAKEGTSIKASNNGTVVMAARGKVYGNSVIIDHGGGLFTLYFHMQKLYVKRGVKVVKGDVIGLVGSTGLSTGPHCHFQMDLFRVPVNPGELITAAAEPDINTRTAVSSPEAVTKPGITGYGYDGHLY